MNTHDMLARLLAQAANDGGDLVTLRAIVEESSELGAQRILEQIGLDDLSAPEDLSELRELLKAWRAAKASAQRTVINWIVRCALGADGAATLTGGRESLRFAGYAALFDERDAGRDIIRPGAFSRTLAARRDPLPLFWQHRPDLRIGWIDRIAEDTRGLRVIAEIDNPDGGAGRALQSGTVTGLSFGYRALAANSDAQGRELHDLELFEISLVTHPMQHRARVHLLS